MLFPLIGYVYIKNQPWTLKLNQPIFNLEISELDVFYTLYQVFFFQTAAEAPHIPLK